MTGSVESLPRTLEEVTPAFLGRALGAARPGTEVDDVRVLDLRQGSATSMRLGVSYTANPSALPTTMYLKGDFTDHGLATRGAFVAEAHFYADVAPTLPDVVNVPRSWFAGVDGDQGIVLLEDLGTRDATFGQPVEPLPVDTVAEGIEQLAAVHAAHWQSPALAAADWIDTKSAVGVLMRFLVQPQHFDDYMGRERAADVPDALRDREAVARALDGMFAHDDGLAWTLVHGDPHLANTFLEPDGRLGFVDWQGVARGPYIWDVTYFLTGALSVEDRRAHERELLEEYLGRLRASGVAAPGPDEAWLAHRRHMMHGFLSMLTPDAMQPDEFAVAMGMRFATAAEDLDTLAACA